MSVRGYMICCEVRWSLIISHYNAAEECAQRHSGGPGEGGQEGGHQEISDAGVCPAHLAGAPPARAGRPQSLAQVPTFLSHLPRSVLRNCHGDGSTLCGVRRPWRLSCWFAIRDHGKAVPCLFQCRMERAAQAPAVLPEETRLSEWQWHEVRHGQDFPNTAVSS